MTCMGLGHPKSCDSNRRICSVYKGVGFGILCAVLMFYAYAATYIGVQPCDTALSSRGGALVIGIYFSYMRRLLFFSTFYFAQ